LGVTDLCPQLMWWWPPSPPNPIILLNIEPNLFIWVMWDWTYAHSETLQSKKYFCYICLPICRTLLRNKKLVQKWTAWTALKWWIQ
jgi:hypothetical protein